MISTNYSVSLLVGMNAIVEAFFPLVCYTLQNITLIYALTFLTLYQKYKL